MNLARASFRSERGHQQQRLLDIMFSGVIENEVLTSFEVKFSESVTNILVSQLMSHNSE